MRGPEAALQDHEAGKDSTSSPPCPFNMAAKGDFQAWAQQGFNLDPSTPVGLPGRGKEGESRSFFIPCGESCPGHGPAGRQQMEGAEGGSVSPHQPGHTTVNVRSSRATGIPAADSFT